MRVTLPLSMPGMVAGTLLMFIPAAGDFINAELLGTPQQSMIGNVIQSRYLELTDYPTAAALSFILMVIMLIIVLVWARIAGTEALLGTEGEARWWRPERRRPRRGPATRPGGRSECGRRLLDAGSTCTRAWPCVYLLVPITVILVFSFNDPRGRFNFIWQEFSVEPGRIPFGGAGHRRRPVEQHPDRRAVDAGSHDPGHDHGPRARSLPVPRPGARNFFIFIPLATPEIVLGAPCCRCSSTSESPPASATILIAHIMFNLSFVVITVRSRLIGFDRSLEEAAQDLGATRSRPSAWSRCR